MLPAAREGEHVIILAMIQCFASHFAEIRNPRKPEIRRPKETRNPKPGFGSQLQNPPQHGNGHIKSEKELSPLLSSFP
jgi:hypothetical protein